MRSLQKIALSSVALAISLLSCHFSAAQFIPYSQYYNSSLLTNPASAAVGDFTQLTVHYRRSRIANYEIPSASFVRPFYRNRDDIRFGGAGLSVVNQKAGPDGLYNITGVLGTFAYTIHFSKTHHLSAGLQGGIVVKRIDLSAITTDSQFNLGAYDASLPNGEDIQFSTASAPVINSGFCWTLTDHTNVPKAMIGIAFSNMNKPVYEFTSLSREPEELVYTITGEMKLLAHGSLSIHPMMRYISGTSSFANLGAQFRWRLAQQDNDVSAAVWYKTTRALVAAVQYNSRNYVMAASVDFSANDDLQAHGNNAIELSLGWRLRRKVRY